MSKEFVVCRLLGWRTRSQGAADVEGSIVAESIASESIDTESIGAESIVAGSIGA